LKKEVTYDSVSIIEDMVLHNRRIDDDDAQTLLQANILALNPDLSRIQSEDDEIYNDVVISPIKTKHVSFTNRVDEWVFRDRRPRRVRFDLSQNEIHPISFASLSNHLFLNQPPRYQQNGETGVTGDNFGDLSQLYEEPQQPRRRIYREPFEPVVLNSDPQQPPTLNPLQTAKNWANNLIARVSSSKYWPQGITTAEQYYHRRQVAKAAKQFKDNLGIEMREREDKHFINVKTSNKYEPLEDEGSSLSESNDADDEQPRIQKPSKRYLVRSQSTDANDIPQEMSVQTDEPQFSTEDLTNFSIPKRSKVNDVMKIKENFKAYTRLLYYLRCKYHLKFRDSTTINTMTSEGRLWMLKEGFKCESAKDYAILASAVMVAYLVSPEELEFRQAIKNLKNFDSMVHLNRTLQGDLGSIRDCSKIAKAKTALRKKASYRMPLPKRDVVF